MRLQGKSSIVEAPCPSAVPDRHFETRPKRLRVVQYVHSRKCFLKLITFLENKLTLIDVILQKEVSDIRYVTYRVSVEA